MYRALLLIAGLCAAFVVHAQTFTWRVADYGRLESIAGVTRQAIAFDSMDAPFVADIIADGNGPGVRVKHFSTAGTLLWQSDLPVSYYAPGEFPPSASTPVASMVSLGDDAIVATTNMQSQLTAELFRLDGADGSTRWHVAEQAPSGVGYMGVTSDARGDIVAVGSTQMTLDGFQNGAVGHVAKFRGSDGTLLWTVDDSADLCNGSRDNTQFRSAAIDANGDVFVIGAAYFSRATAFCLIKFAGNDGAVLWRLRYVPTANFQSLSTNLALDINGNAVVGGTYETSSNTYALLMKFAGGSGGALWIDDPLPISAAVSGVPFQIDSDGNVVVVGQNAEKFSGSTGHALWAQPAAVSGQVTIASDGTIVVAQNNAVDPNVITGRRIDFSGLDPADGSTRWTSTLPLDTIAYWDQSDPIAADAHGHFVALQAEDGPCCTEDQSLVARLDAATGAIDWSLSDRDFGPARGVLHQDGTNRTTLPTPDGDVVSVGIVHPGSGDDWGSGLGWRIMTVKRSGNDGRLRWSRTLDVSYDFCQAHALSIDSAGDVLVGGACDRSILLKYRGSDGVLLWQADTSGTPQFGEVDSLATDAANNVYATGYASDSSFIRTVKYSATGTTLWSVTAPFSASTFTEDALLALTPLGDVLTAFSAAPAVVQKRSAATGAIEWTASSNMPAPTALAAAPNGDALVGSSYGSIVRLAATDGHSRWTTPYANGTLNRLLPTASNDVIAAGYGIARYAAETGTLDWSVQTDATFADAIFDADGAVLATGSKQPTPQSAYELYVVKLDAVSGTTQWNLLDSAIAPNADEGVGIVLAPDGGILVAANYAVVNASPWSLVRISGPFADGIFAGGFEP